MCGGGGGGAIVFAVCGIDLRIVIIIHVELFTSS